MSELDKKKAELGFWEKIFFALFAAIFAMAGWLSSNYKTADFAFLLATSVIFVFAVLFVVLAYNKIQRIINEIGEL